MANKFRSSVAELSQGVRNANDGAGQLQIIDGGLNNINKIVDRLKTLATQSGSDTFTGDRGSLNSEYQSLIKELDRQANNIGLVDHGAFNNKLSVYLGGGSTQANAQVTVDLSGTANQVDSTGLNIKSTGIDAGGTDLDNNAVTDLNNASKMVLVGATANRLRDQLRRFHRHAADQVRHRNLHGRRGPYCIGCGLAVEQADQHHRHDCRGEQRRQVGFGRQQPLRPAGRSVTGGAAVDGGLVSDASSGINKADYNVKVAAFASMAGSTGAPEIVSFSNGSVTKFVTIDRPTPPLPSWLKPSMTRCLRWASRRSRRKMHGGSQRRLRYPEQQQLHDEPGPEGFGRRRHPSRPWAVEHITVGQAIAVTDPDSYGIHHRQFPAALAAIDLAVAKLGQVQGRVGAGENQLQYAINLAQSQISNFSSAEAQIRDADVAAEAANLTKAQVLTQASMAAMAQANSAPQQVLSLLRG